MHKLKWIFAVFALTLLTLNFGLAAAPPARAAPPTPAPESPTNQVARQFREYCLHESTDHGARLLDDVELPKTSPEQAAKLLASLQPDGSWPDIDYASQARSSWPPATHLTRALGLTVYARRPATAPADAAAAIAAVHRTLAYWKSHDYQCPNWWYNQIGVPKILGNTALLLNTDLSSDERAYITATVLPRAKVGAMTGQNKVWLAANGLMRAALTADEPALRQAADVIQSELTSSTAEGIQPDFSFHQHGPQQQFGNYGMAYAVEMTRWATVLRNTPFAFPPAKITLLSNYLLQGESWITWRGAMDISACGRQLFPNSPVSKAGVIAGTLRAMALADAPRAPDYLAFVTRNASATAPNDLVGTRYYYRSDYLLHRRPDEMISLKMSSTRVIGGETVNNENLSGLHLADGATFFYCSGREYDDIFPAWNWHLIPGTTSTLDNSSLTWPATPDLKKNTEFAGAVTDGAFACAAMDFHRDSLAAKKAWFFYNDTLLCLGTAITSNSPDPVVTTINQCLFKPPVRAQIQGTASTLTEINLQLANPDWLENDGLRYTPLNAPTLLVKGSSQTGNWKKVFNTPATPKDDVKQNVLTLTVPHGARPQDAQYAYAVTPAGSAPDIDIVANLATVQIAAFGTGNSKCTAAVFYGPAMISARELVLTTDGPCLLLITPTRVTVCDPTQKRKTLRLGINDKSAIVNLPQGGDAGKSVEVPGMR